MNLILRRMDGQKFKFNKSKMLKFQFLYDNSSFLFREALFIYRDGFRLFPKLSLPPLETRGKATSK